MRAALALASAVVVGGCATGGAPGFAEDEAPQSAQKDSKSARLGGEDGPLPITCGKMDFLFVIDDSGSMSEEQEEMRKMLPRLVSTLESYRSPQGVALDYRLAITTTGRDLNYRIRSRAYEEHGDNGAFRFRRDCGMQRPWIARGDAEAAKVFACAADVGIAGPNLEMPLLALRLSLTDRVEDGTNRGFLRDDALLTIVVVTDEDDCSRSDDNFDITTQLCTEHLNGGEALERSVTFLDSVKGRARWATMVIAGGGPGICVSSTATALNAPRLRAFADMAGKLGKFDSICDGPMDRGLDDALRAFEVSCQMPIR
jgi:hypothetical protein